MEIAAGLSAQEILFVLFLVGMLAGLIDAIAGGGGMIAVPSLLLAGVPPLVVLGTNRMQACIGEFTAFATYLHAGVVRTQAIGFGLGMTAIGAVLGTAAVSYLSADFLEVILPVMMLGITGYVILSKRLRHSVAGKAHLSVPAFMLLCGLGIGFYNGFFGPGTGSIWMMAFIALLGFTVKDATIATKPMNLMGNIVSFASFAWIGAVDYRIGAVMGAGQVLGAVAGGRIVIANGDRIVRPVFITVTTVMTVKVLFDALDGSAQAADLSKFLMPL